MTQTTDKSVRKELWHTKGQPDMQLTDERLQLQFMSVRLPWRQEVFLSEESILLFLTKPLLVMALARQCHFRIVLSNGAPMGKAPAVGEQLNDCCPRLDE